MRRNFGGLKIATIGEVDIKLHFSLIFILLYVVMVATYEFPQAVNQSGVDVVQLYNSPLVWGLAFALSLFASILFHELGHVFVAKKMGIEVRAITLMMLGGVSEMEHIPETRLTEFKISIIGPLVSFAIALILYVVGQNTNSSNLAFYCHWVGQTNLILGVFNLLPAFPLDGGRLFRSLLALHYGPAKATQIAVRVARTFAWVLLGIGLITFNILLTLIAFFIYIAASSELVLAVSRSLLKNVRAEDVGIKTTVLDSTISLEDAAKIMVSEHKRTLPIVRGSAARVLSLSSFKNVPRDEWQSKTAFDLATDVPRSIDVNEFLDDALPEIASYEALPLTDQNKIVGIIRYSDLIDLIEFQSLGMDSEKKVA